MIEAYLMLLFANNLYGAAIWQFNPCGYQLVEMSIDLELSQVCIAAHMYIAHPNLRDCISRAFVHYRGSQRRIIIQCYILIINTFGRQ